jgi:hypothetical protein
LKNNVQRRDIRGGIEIFSDFWHLRFFFDYLVFDKREGGDKTPPYLRGLTLFTSITVYTVPTYSGTKNQPAEYCTIQQNRFAVKASIIIY